MSNQWKVAFEVDVKVVIVTLYSQFFEIYWEESGDMLPPTPLTILNSLIWWLDTIIYACNPRSDLDNL